MITQNQMLQRTTTIQDNTITTVTSTEQAKVSASVKTYIGRANELLKLTGKPLVSFDTKSTLNSYLNVLPDDIPTEVPTLKYFGIGNGGQWIKSLTSIAAHDVLDTNLGPYNMIPFRVVPIEEDLSSAERANYRMRKLITGNDNQRYVGYYLKVMNIDNDVSFTQSAEDGTTTPYTPDYSNLHPTPPNAPINGTIEALGAEIVVGLNMLFSVTGKEFAESIGVLYDGDLTKAILSELCLYTGEDKQVKVTAFDGTTFEMTEAIGAQMYMHNAWMGSQLTSPNAVLTLSVDLISGDLTVK